MLHQIEKYFIPNTKNFTSQIWNFIQNHISFTPNTKNFTPNIENFTQNNKNFTPILHHFLFTEPGEFYIKLEIIYIKLIALLGFRINLTEIMRIWLENYEYNLTLTGINKLN